MADNLKAGSKASFLRGEIWRHNSFHGHVVMMIANCNSILDAKTTTQESKRLAQQIQILAAELKISLKERVK